MAVIKCKMCGGDLNITKGTMVAECEYCGTKQTVPNVDNEKKLILFARANRLRLACEFDKAAGVYESIVAEFPTEAEAYWGLVLCRYGIEYMDDPATGKKVPTCHRSSLTSVLEDSDFEQACENADAMVRRVYRDEAKAIEELRQGIVEVSGREEPYDIFICYKETDEDGQRTLDSVLAQDVYDALVEKGYRVFFSRITLEDKLGQEYEHYIFAALHSAKLMLVFGTDYEYFDAVWVKNEWIRYLKLMAQDKSKHLIPCYKGIDAYDMPKELAKLQARDMDKVGAVQDLLREVEKFLAKSEQIPVQAVVQSGRPGVASLIERGKLFLEDGDWENAARYFDRVLDIAPKCSDAYMGKVLVAEHVSSFETLRNKSINLRINRDFSRALQFSTGAQYQVLQNFYTEWEKEKQAFIEKRRKELAPAAGLIGASDAFVVGLRSDGTVMAVTRGEIYSGWCNVRGWCDIVAVATSDLHAVGLRSDGTVVAMGGNGAGQNNVQGWRDIIAVAVGYGYTVGLRSNGTVVATGNNNSGRCNVQDWRDIAAVATNGHTVGLRSNGTVVATGDNDSGQCNVQDWRDIVAIATGIQYTVGLRSDGTVVAVGNNDFGQCNVQDWRDIVTVATSGHTVGLRSDGTVVATGNDFCGQCDVQDWCDIVAVATDCYHTVGLRSDGTVVAVGSNESGQCNVQNWRNIIAVATSIGLTVGLRSDGTMMAVGNNESVCNVVQGWKLFNNIDTLEEERIEARKHSWKKRQRKLLLEKEAEEQALMEKAAAERKLLLEKRRKKWELATSLIGVGDNHTVGLRSDGTVVVAGDNHVNECNVQDWRDIVVVVAGNWHTVGLRLDGTVVATGANYGNECNVRYWGDIVAVAADCNHTVGLRLDGTVVATKDNDKGQCDVRNWKDIVAVAVCGLTVVGLKSDGTVVAVGLSNYSGQCNVQNWRDIAAVATSGHTVGLRSNGTVVATGNNDRGQCNVQGWRDIVAVATGNHYTVGLRSDGTVVATGNNDRSQCNVQGWRDIVAVATGNDYTVGLKSDGMVVATGYNDRGQCDVQNWRDIVAVATRYKHTVGLRSDGTVVATGNNDSGQCNVQDWKLFNSIDTLEEEREKKKDALEAERSALQVELASLNGLFVGSRRRKIEARLAAIEKTIRRISMYI